MARRHQTVRRIPNIAYRGGYVPQVGYQTPATHPKEVTAAMGVRPINQRFVAERQQVILPRGSGLWKQGRGWWLYWNPHKQQTYLIQQARGGKNVLTYPGKAIPPCCRG